MAKERASNSNAKKPRFNVWHRPGNLDKRKLVATRTAAELDRVSPQWRIENVASDFNYNFMMVGGWNSIGIHDDVDGILGDIVPLPSKITPRMRGQFLKEMLEQDGRVAASFFDDRAIIRRAHVVPPAISPRLMNRGRQGMEFIERDRRGFLSIEGFTFSAPHMDSNTKENPTTGIYSGEEVLFTPVKDRLLEIVSRRFHADEMILLRWSNVKDWSYQSLFQVLSDAGFPLIELAMLIPLSLDAFRRFVYRSMNTIMLGTYGDNAALKETWPTGAYYMIIIYTQWQWKSSLSKEKKEEICLEITKPGVDMFGRASSASEDTLDFLDFKRSLGSTRKWISIGSSRGTYHRRGDQCFVTINEYTCCSS